MQNRLKSLDGLRGLAALAVLLSHSAFNPNSVFENSIFYAVYRTLAVGPNSVQILFVLCGFFMAYLYSDVKSYTQFLKKRYARIFSIFAVIVAYLWYTSMTNAVFGLPAQLLFMLELAIFVHVMWSVIDHFDKKRHVGTILFWAFFLLQIGMFVFNLAITPKFIELGSIMLPDMQKKMLVLLSNLTLTTPLAKGVYQISGVFWSLAPEVLFYVVYPLVVIPLVRLGKRLGILASIFISLAVIKILFDLDNNFTSQAALYTINIARASGFVMGVLVGTIYHSRDKMWELLEKIFSNRFANIFAFIGLWAVQYGDTAIRHGKSIFFMNTYYLLSSVVIGFVIIAAIIPKTFTNRFFSNRILGFLGMISYSLYLSHPIVSNWIEFLLDPIEKAYPFAYYQLIYLVCLIAGNMLISFLLYRLVEYLYFASKAKKTITASPEVATKPNTVEKKLSFNHIIVGTTLTVGLFFMIYSGGYAPTLLVKRHSIHTQTSSSNGEISFLEKKKVQFPITADHANLGFVKATMRYEKDAEHTREYNKKPAQFFFRMYEEGKKTPVFESQRDAFEIAGEPHFPFGLPLIADSANKKYIVELEQVGGSKTDQVFLSTSTNSIVTGYQNSKAELIKKPYTLVLNRFVFAMQDPAAVFAIAFTLLVGAGLIFVKKKHHKVHS